MGISDNFINGLMKEPASFWPWPQDKSTVSKIIIPLIRRIMPTMIASELVGIQPMDIADYVCLICNIVIRKLPLINSNQIKKCCHLCGNLELKPYSVFDMEDLNNIGYYRARSVLIQTKEEADKTDMKVSYTTFRPFITDDIEPNEKYRSWLEEHVGKQKVTWDWDIYSENFELLEIKFTNKQSATLFELTWP